VSNPKVVRLARAIAADIAEFARPPVQHADDRGEVAHLEPGNALLAEYDRRITDEDIRAATRTRFVTEHYADAVEAGVKALCDCVRAKSNRLDDGDSLMTNVFSPNDPILRINPGRSKSDESEQRGHMHICQGVVGAWRNPRAHSLVVDSPERALMMLETIQDLTSVTKAATRTRKRRKK
jgi:uncharacterized protein (TIGR02391 family)